MAVATLPAPPPLSIYITVSNATAAIDFYVKAFGAKELRRHQAPDKKRLIHAALDINGGLLMLSDDFPEHAGGVSRIPSGPTGVTIHLDLPDVDRTFAQAIEAGAKVKMPLENQFWGDRYGQLEDPFGHRWSLATRKAELSAADIEAAAQKTFDK